MKTKLAPYPLDLVVKKADGLGMYTQAETSLDVDKGAVIVEFNLAFSREDLEDAAVHEAVHVKQFVEEAISGKLDDETEAYFVAFVKTALLKGLDKYIKSKRGH